MATLGEVADSAEKAALAFEKMQKALLVFAGLVGIGILLIGISMFVKNTN